MKSGCWPLPALTSWPGDGPDANSTTASSPAAGSRRAHSANGFANMVFSQLRCQNAAHSALPPTNRSTVASGDYHDQILRVPFVVVIDTASPVGGRRFLHGELARAWSQSMGRAAGSARPGQLSIW